MDCELPGHSRGCWIPTLSLDVPLCSWLSFRIPLKDLGLAHLWPQLNLLSSPETHRNWQCIFLKSHTSPLENLPMVT